MAWHRASGNHWGPHLAVDWLGMARLAPLCLAMHWLATDRPAMDRLATDWQAMDRIAMAGMSGRNEWPAAVAGMSGRNEWPE